MSIELQYFEGCPNWKVADGRLRPLAEALGIEIGYRLVSTPEEAEIARFRGSPTILIDGCDPFASGDEPVGLSCRVYQTPDGPAGSPTIGQLADALGTRASMTSRE